MKTYHFHMVFVSAFVFFSFSQFEQYNCRRSGIKGHVYLVSGDQMPSPDAPQSTPKGVKTTLYIYSLTNISEVSRERSSGFYKSISTELVKEIQTDEEGYFKTIIKPGMYSLFVKKGNLLFSSQFDEKNNIHPVEVKSGKMAEVIFKANYNAVY